MVKEKHLKGVDWKTFSASKDMWPNMWRVCVWKNNKCYVEVNKHLDKAITKLIKSLKHDNSNN